MELRPYAPAACRRRGGGLVYVRGSARTSIGLLVIAVTAVSFSAIFIRLAHAPPLVTGAARMAIAGLLGLPLIAQPHYRPSLDRTSVRFGGLAILSLTVHYATWIASLSYTSVASAVLLVNVHPLVVMLIERVGFGRRLRAHAAWGALIALAGMVLLVGKDFSTGPRPFLGDVLALTGALGTAGYVVCGEVVRRRVATLPYTTILYLATGGSLTLLALLFHESWPGHVFPAYVYFAALALIPTLLGHTLVNAALGTLKASVVAIALLGEPILTSVWAWIVLAQTPSLIQAFGGAIALGGLTFALRPSAVPVP